MAVAPGGAVSRSGRATLSGLLRGSRDVLVLRSAGTAEEAVRALLGTGTETHSLTHPVPRSRERDAVVLAVRDLVDLRRSIAAVAGVGTASKVAVWFGRDVPRLPVASPQGEWPPLEEVVASRSGDRFVLLSFAAAAPVRHVLLHLAAAAAPSGGLAVGWPTLGARREEPDRWPVADPSARVALLPRLLDPSVDSPADLLLLGPAAPARDLPGTAHPVLGRPPRATVVEPDATWEQLSDRSDAEVADLLTGLGPGSLGAVDEQVVNPIGFDRDPVGDPAALVARGVDRLAVGTRSRAAPVLDTGRGLSEGDLPALRRLAGISLDWRGARGPQAYCRMVASLAMAGVPLVTDHVPAWARSLLAPELADALARPADLSTPLPREEHSIRLRRAALSAHATGPWRRRLADRHGLQQVAPPRVSVLLVTRRPEMLEFALRQVARQRGLEIDLVLATHGFEPARQVLDAFREASPVPVTTLREDRSVPFGEVLNRAAARATGDLLLKIDDDDWYGPDFVADLVLAHGYSGAEVVGCSAEFTFLHPLWLTTRQAVPTEAYRALVAGGTMLMERAALRSLGGFRHTVKHVDANLLAAVRAAGGSVYRTHGLGYVLRRGTEGHTWDPGLGYFLAPDRASEQWRGFRPSSLLEPDPDDLPDRSGG